MKIAKSVPSLEMCDPAEQFNVDFFFNKGLLYMKDSEVFFYEVGQTEAAIKAERSSVTDKATLEWKMELEGVRADIRDIKTELSTLASTVLGLKEPLGVHTDRMTEALTLMMKMVNFVEQRTPRPQQSPPPKTIPKKSVPTAPATMPVKKRKDPAPSTASESSGTSTRNREEKKGPPPMSLSERSS